MDQIKSFTTDLPVSLIERMKDYADTGGLKLKRVIADALIEKFPATPKAAAPTTKRKGKR